MSHQKDYEKLGVNEESSFEEIQAAKEKLKSQHLNDEKELQMIEAAYDAILMDRLRLRQEGKIKVPDRIRFPEKITPPPSIGISEATNNAPSWLKNLIDTPSQKDILWPSGIYVGLSALSIFAGINNPAILQLTLALGVGGCLYFLNRKENKFGRSVLLTVVAFITGLILGGILAPLLAGLGLTNEILITVFTFIVLWAISCFCR